MQRSLFAFVAFLGLLLPVCAAEPLSFNRDIRPILSDHCFQCHGPDENHRGGGLRLDLSASARQGGDSGPAIVPGDHKKGELWQRVTSTDADMVMPPPSTGKPLNDKQRDTLRRWIDQGAEYQGHWAFQRVERPKVPTQVPSANPIDAFIRARLHAEGLAPSPAAAKETLIRRVTLDLTGLPPTPAEIDSFLADDSPQAYERVVDRLLASPHYGERMALPWLDAARYADSNGFQTDSSRQMSPWRDWVIAAFNRNQPFDQFTIEQLAGDMLPNPTRDQLVATGFNRNARLNGEGGRIVEEWFVETVIDRVETVGLTWMGLTFNCCRCHDHKYDPISQREFYQLFAIFNSVEELGVLDNNDGPGNGNRLGGNSHPIMRLPNQEQEEHLAELQSQIVAAEKKLAEVKKGADQRRQQWEKTAVKPAADAAPLWNYPAAREVVASAGTKFAAQVDNSYLAIGKAPAHEDYTWTGKIPAGKFTGILLEALPDDSLPNKSVGRHANGNFVLSGLQATVTTGEKKTARPIKFSAVRADYEQAGYPISSLLPGKKSKGKTPGWAVDGNTQVATKRAIFVVEEPFDLPANAVLTVTLQHRALEHHQIGRFRIGISSAPQAQLNFYEGGLPPAVAKALRIAADKRNATQQKAISDYFSKEVDTELKAEESKVTAAKKARSDFEGSIPTTMILRERAEPRTARILKRGEYDKPGDAVTRGLPAMLPPLPAGEPLNRLGFARWLVSREHPLTARVWVNRAWERFMGAGLVRTTENLGSQSEWPSHYELLEWLAAEFMEPTMLPAVNGEPAHAWDIKALDKLIVMSATYCQSASVTHDRDPENRLLSRGPRFRLPAEIARDQALAVSGLLVKEIGGRSVRPYMPDGVWDETSVYGDLRGYKADTGAGLYRRSLYTIWKRTAAPPSMLLFDAPNREICTVKRSRTNTPLQALALLNEVTYVEAARKLGERMLREGGDTPDSRLAYGFRLVTARLPNERELRVLREGYDRDKAKYAADPAAAEKLLAVGQSPPTKTDDSATAAALTLAANVLLNLDEAVTRE